MFACILLLWYFYRLHENAEQFAEDCAGDVGDMQIVKMNHSFYGDIYLYKHNDMISKLVREGNVWENYIIEVMAEYYEEGTDIMDIGANMGLNSLGTHKLKPFTGTLHCFEPQYHSMALCVYNTSSIPKVKYYQFALSSKYDQMSFTPVNENVGGTSMTPSLEHKNVIASVPLDSITFTNRISVMKIDVEGMEDRLLEGATNTILKHKPTIIIEIWESMFPTTSKVLEKLNYKLEKRIGVHDYVYKYSEVFTS